MVQKTFVAIKPDGVQRGIVGEIIKRFENAGLKIVGMKMVWVDEEFALKHYTDDLAQRRGQHVRDMMVSFIQEGPVVALALEGVGSIGIVRKIVGGTEPAKAAPGTIRGDFSHVSFDYADKKKQVVKNVIHASANQEDAENELKLWFTEQELQSYPRVEEKHIY